MIEKAKVIIALFIVTLISAQANEQEEKVGAWLRLSYSHSQADDYHTGSASTASSLFRDGNAEYEINSINFEGAYNLPKDFFVYANLQLADSDIENVPANGDETSFKLRSYTLGLGKNFYTRYGLFKLAAFHTINEDDDFFKLASVSPIPVTNGSDSTTLMLAGEHEFYSLIHKWEVNYTHFEHSSTADRFNFTLGDAWSVSYELGKNLTERFYAGLEYTVYRADETDGNFLYNQPKYESIGLNTLYSFDNGLALDLSVNYIHDGSDAPQQVQVTSGVSYSF